MLETICKVVINIAITIKDLPKYQWFWAVVAFCIATACFSEFVYPKLFSESISSNSNLPVINSALNHGGVILEEAEENIPKLMPAFVLYDEKPIKGQRNQEEGPTESNYGDQYYDSLKFVLSTIDESTKNKKLVYLNTDKYDLFSGVFYIPSLEEGASANTVNVVIRADGKELFNDTLKIDSEPVPFEVNISGAKEIEIACYFIDGKASGVIGGGSRAYVNLTEAQFSKKFSF